MDTRGVGAESQCFMGVEFQVEEMGTFWKQMHNDVDGLKDAPLYQNASLHVSD